ncbi:MAG: hypothetical protein AB7G93_23075 [Bdellovibrionales bacterium]
MRLALAVIFFQSMMCWGATTPTVGTHWPQIIDKLIGAGVTRVGSFDLVEFRRSASDPDGMHWGSFSGVPPSLLSGSRQSDFYLRCRHQAYVSNQLPPADFSSLPLWELHIVLGARCFWDDDYSKSMALLTLSETTDSGLRQWLLQAYGPLFSPPWLMAGGSSVSSGGDLEAVAAKDAVRRRVILESQRTGTDVAHFLLAHPSIVFEPLHDDHLESVYLKYDYFPRFDERGRSEVFSVYVPIKRWRAGEAAREQLVLEIARNVTSLFPVSRNPAFTSFHTFQPSACASRSQQISFPATQDPAARSIQDFRGGILLGCQSLTKETNYWSATSPILDQVDEPKEPGYYYFKCQIDYRSFHETFRFRMRPGTGLGFDHTRAASFNRGDTLNFVTNVDAYGQITSSQIYYAAPGASPVYASGPLRLNGYDLTYSCAREP